MIQSSRLIVAAAAVTAAWLVCADIPASAQQAPPAPPKSAKPEPPAAGRDKRLPSPEAAPGAEKAPRSASPLANKKPETPQQRAKLLDDLYAHLAAAEDEKAAGEITQSIARLWMNSGSETVDVLTQRALKAVHAKQFDVAKRLLDSVVVLAPDHADGWSNRGHVHYLDNNVELALGDLRRALALDPSHFKALDGLGTILREIGQKKGALQAYQQLLSVHPFAAGAKQAHDDLKREVDGQGI